jgi:hypothetical protein
MTFCPISHPYLALIIHSDVGVCWRQRCILVYHTLRRTSSDLIFALLLYSVSYTPTMLLADMFDVDKPLVLAKYLRVFAA